jgi:hypothetical protein
MRRLYNPEEPHVLNSYLSMTIAACFSSMRTKRPCATSFRGRTPFKSAGQLTASSTSSPSTSVDSVVNSTPRPLMFRVLPDPTCFTLCFPPSTLYRTSRMIGILIEERRSSERSRRCKALFPTGLSCQIGRRPSIEQEYSRSHDGDGPHVRFHERQKGSNRGRSRGTEVPVRVRLVT